jgi:tRNA 2-thiocytidine biosynthesis protein TtcA
MMADWDSRFPGRTEAVFSALQKVIPSHLADNACFDFKNLRVGMAMHAAGGDTLFDPPALSGTPEQKLRNWGLLS